MRGVRWLVLAVMVAILFGVGMAYRKQLIAQRDAPVVETPAPLPPQTSSTSAEGGWTFKDNSTGCKTVEIRFSAMSRAANASRTDLDGVKLRLYHKCEDRFDLVESDKANFFDGENRLFAEGVVTIHLGERSDQDTPASLVAIKSSGVTFDTQTGHADTDKPTTFEFKNGEGQATGATYDPPTRELFMKNDVKIHWRAAAKPGEQTPPKPLDIEAPSLYYHEASKEIDLVPTGKLVHGDAVFEGDKPVIHMEDDGKGHRTIRQVDGSKVHGTDVMPARKLQYSADHVLVDYSEAGKLQKVNAEGNARVVSASEFAETTVTGNHVDLFFDPAQKESVMTQATCSGHAVVVSKPLPAAGREPGESHVMRSESIDLQMRPGGREIATVSSHVPGTVEFLPNLPVQHHRVIEGREMVINYGAQNRLQTFHAVDVKTTSDPTAAEKQRNRGVAVTTSNEITAKFNQAGHLASIEQAGNFTYAENDRKARAATATMDADQNVIMLDRSTRISDVTGTTTADKVRLDQRTGDFTAEGNVNSARLPNQEQKKGSQMLSSDSPLQAQAQKMVSTNHNRHTRYDGNVLLWQGVNRIQANVVDIDSDQHNVVADGNVVSEFWEQPKPSARKDAVAVLTKVHAPHLIYTDHDRLAVYSGGTLMERPGMTVQSKELRAWLADSGSDSRLDRAVADGAVDIKGKGKDQLFHTQSEHAEYYACDPDKPKPDGSGAAACPQKLMLDGGQPKLVRTHNGTDVQSTGSKLTYWPNDGSLQVNGDRTDGISTRIPGKRP